MSEHECPDDAGAEDAEAEALLSEMTQDTIDQLAEATAADQFRDLMTRRTRFSGPRTADPSSTTPEP